MQIRMMNESLWGHESGRKERGKRERERDGEERGREDDNRREVVWDGKIVLLIMTIKFCYP
jgi:hypothetical protein